MYPIVIREGTKAAEGVSPEDVAKRARVSANYIIGEMSDLQEEKN